MIVAGFAVPLYALGIGFALVAAGAFLLSYSMSYPFYVTDTGDLY